MLYLDYSRKDGEWVPNRYGGRENLEAIDFLRQLNAGDARRVPGRRSRSPRNRRRGRRCQPPVYLGGLGFTCKWNMGWMHDMLEYVQQDPIHRKYHHNELTFRMLYAFTENFILPFSHDEVVHGKGSMLGKMPGDDWQRFANAAHALRLHVRASRARSCCSWATSSGSGARVEQRGKPPLGHGGRDATTRAARASCAISTASTSASPRCTSSISIPRASSGSTANDNENSVFSFVRVGRDGHELIVVVLNFTPVVRIGYRIGVPHPGTYVEVLNSDADAYGGSNVGNAGVVTAEPFQAHGRAQSLALTLPPLGALYLKWER